RASNTSTRSRSGGSTTYSGRCWTFGGVEREPARGDRDGAGASSNGILSSDIGSASSPPPTFPTRGGDSLQDRIESGERRLGSKSVAGFSDRAGTIAGGRRSTAPSSVAGRAGLSWRVPGPGRARGSSGSWARIFGVNAAQRKTDNTAAAL